MDSPNAVTFNASMNTVFAMNPMVEIVVCIAIIAGIGVLLSGCVGKAF